VVVIIGQDIPTVYFDTTLLRLSTLHIKVTLEFELPFSLPTGVADPRVMKRV